MLNPKSFILKMDIQSQCGVSHVLVKVLISLFTQESSGAAFLCQNLINVNNLFFNLNHIGCLSLPLEMNKRSVADIMATIIQHVGQNNVRHTGPSLLW